MAPFALVAGPSVEEPLNCERGLLPIHSGRCPNAAAGAGTCCYLSDASASMRPRPFGLVESAAWTLYGGPKSSRKSGERGRRRYDFIVAVLAGRPARVRRHINARNIRLGEVKVS